MSVRTAVIPFVVTILLAACGTDPVVIEVANQGWPDGTGILAVSDGRVAGRTRLYGDRARITVDRPGLYSLRIAHPAHYADATNVFQVPAGTTGLTLDPPVPRRTIDGKLLGLDIECPDAGETTAAFLTGETPPVTAVTVPTGLADSTLESIVSAAHDRLVAVYVRFTGDETARMLTVNGAAIRLDSLAMAGVDGVAMTTGPESIPSLAPIITEAHKRGMSVSVLVNMASDNLPTEPVTATGTSLPDEVSIAVLPESPSGSLNPVDGFDRLLNSVWLRSLTPADIVLSFSLSARTPDGLPEAGALMQALEQADGSGLFRLRDGSLRLGHRGTDYRFDDPESVAIKLNRLRQLGAGAIGGVCLNIDGRGIMPDRDGLAAIGDLLRSW